MFLVSPIAAFVVTVFTIFLGLYIYFGTTGSDYGSAIRGIQLDLAQRALLNISRGSLATQLQSVMNWRPHIMLLYYVENSSSETDDDHQGSLALATQLKMARGLL